MDAVALASVIGSTIVGIAGLTSAALTSRAERAARREEASATRQHEREAAHRERRFERQAETYVDLLVYLAEVSERIESTYPVVTYGPTTAPAEAEGDANTPTAEDVGETGGVLLDLQARVSAYGSRELVEQVDAYVRQVQTFFLDVGTFEVIRNQGGGPGQLADARQRLQDTRQESRTIYDEIRRRVREELAAA